MGTTSFPPLDFDFYKHLKPYFSVALSARATWKMQKKKKLSKYGEKWQDICLLHKNKTSNAYVSLLLLSK